MLADTAAVLRALKLPPESEVEIEPAGPGVERWLICAPGRERQEVALRRHPSAEFAANHAAVVESLSRTEFPHMPRPLATIGDVVVEEALAAMTAIALMPPDGSMEAAMQALAALHSLDVQEGLRWEASPNEVLAEEEPPLHRLGFAAHERDAAAPWLASGRAEILRSAWGFAHGDATAQHVLLARGQAWLVSYHAAGFGPQLFDVAAFLLTSGLAPDGRREAAAAYTRMRGLDSGTEDLVDLAGILWGIGELLTLPRRSIEMLGDDAASSALNVAALRIERGIREPAGAQRVAAGIRAALWPA